MNDQHFAAAVRQFEASPEALGVSGLRQMMQETLERLEKAEASLMQIGFTHNDDKLFLSLNLTDEQSAVFCNATDAVRKPGDFNLESELTQILTEWLQQKEITDVKDHD